MGSHPSLPADNAAHAAASRPVPTSGPHIIPGSPTSTHPGFTRQPTSSTTSPSMPSLDGTPSAEDGLQAGSNSSVRPPRQSEPRGMQAPDDLQHPPAPPRAALLSTAAGAAGAPTVRAGGSRATHCADTAGPLRVQLAGHERGGAALQQQLRLAQGEARDREGALLVLRSQLEAERGATAAALAVAAAATAAADAGPGIRTARAGAMGAAWERQPGQAGQLLTLWTIRMLACLL